ncbi:MAG: hypothetical protein ACJAVM_002289 [Sulfitobacter sp.]|jgi:hypothetical protein
MPVTDNSCKVCQSALAARRGVWAVAECGYWIKSVIYVFEIQGLKFSLIRNFACYKKFTIFIGYLGFPAAHPQVNLSVQVFHPWLI